MTDWEPPFGKILVANRGEIAVRVIKAIHDVGAEAVAVYSDPDEFALHVLHADEAYRIGPGPATESYLNMEAILEAARRSGAEAIHPGYGFLSENADFAQAVIDAGMVFIGPPPKVIRLMGDKIAAKRLMAENGVPLIPGYDGEDQSEATFRQEADRIGYPVMVKAAAGGGGRGMREVGSEGELAAALEGARREATAAFGDGRLFLEKLLIAPRHIEVQVLGDSHGNLVHLYERDCSVQRRHQKVIEEAPSPALNDEQRQAICDAGLRAARAAGYFNAGTVEFLWQDGQFYFLEMNTRIQVEHPVTEEVVGLDLVIEQIRVAAGETLGYDQDEIELESHAIEARLYAEDPYSEYLPQAGHIVSIEFGGGGRVDTGVESGHEVSRHYDPMIAKFIARRETRTEALDQLSEMLATTRVVGPVTNLDFLRWLVTTPELRAGEATAKLTESWSGNPIAGASDQDDDLLLAIFVGTTIASGEVWSTSNSTAGARPTPWIGAGGWRLAGQGCRLACQVRGRSHLVEGRRRPDMAWLIRIDSMRERGEIRFGRLREDQESGTFWIREGRKTSRFLWESAPDGDEDGKLGTLRRLGTYDRTAVYPASILESGWGPAGHLRRTETAGMVSSPMPGSLISIDVSLGDRVMAHQALMVIEAMKMEHVLEAPHTGVVRTIHHAVGDLVPAGEPLIEIGPE